jgi:hypothetical protein
LRRAIGAIVPAMSGTRKILLGMLLGSLTAAGCTYVAVTPSVNGRAYVVKTKGKYLLGSSTLWNCDATSGTPTCYQVKNVDNGPVTVSGGGGGAGASASASTPAAGEATNE